MKLMRVSPPVLPVELAGSVTRGGMVTGSSWTITLPPSSSETFWNAGGITGGWGGGGGRAGTTDSPNTVALVMFSVEPVKTYVERNTLYCYTISQRTWLRWIEGHTLILLHYYTNYHNYLI